MAVKDKRKGRTISPHTRPNHRGGNTTPISKILSKHNTPFAKALIDLGWRVKDVAPQVDSTADTLSLYLSGKRVPPLTTAHKIKTFLNKQTGREYTVDSLFPATK